MTARQLLHPEIGLRQRKASARVLDRAEMLLLLITIFMLMLVIGLRVRDSVAGPVEPVMARITVQAGDTLWTLAKEYGDPNQYILERVDHLARTNGLKRGDVLHAGETLTIPVTNRSAELYYGGKICKQGNQERSL